MFYIALLLYAQATVTHNYVYYCQDTSTVSHSDKVLYINSH